MGYFHQPQLTQMHIAPLPPTDIIVQQRLLDLRVSFLRQWGGGVLTSTALIPLHSPTRGNKSIQEEPNNCAQPTEYAHRKLQLAKLVKTRAEVLHAEWHFFQIFIWPQNSVGSWARIFNIPSPWPQAGHLADVLGSFRLGPSPWWRTFGFKPGHWPYVSRRWPLALTFKSRAERALLAVPGRAGPGRAGPGLALRKFLAAPD